MSAKLSLAAIKDVPEHRLGTKKQMYSVAVGLVINDAQASVEKIKQVNQGVKVAVQTITTIDKVIAIAAGVIKIGASVRSKDIGGIVEGIGQVPEAVAS